MSPDFLLISYVLLKWYTDLRKTQLIVLLTSLFRIILVHINFKSIHYKMLILLTPKVQLSKVFPVKCCFFFGNYFIIFVRVFTAIDLLLLPIYPAELEREKFLTRHCGPYTRYGSLIILVGYNAYIHCKYIICKKLLSG